MAACSRHFSPEMPETAMIPEVLCTIVNPLTFNSGIIYKCLIL